MILIPIDGRPQDCPLDSNMRIRMQLRVRACGSIGTCNPCKKLKVYKR